MKHNQDLSKYVVCSDGKIRKSYNNFNDGFVFYIVLALMAISVFVIR